MTDTMITDSLLIKYIAGEASPPQKSEVLLWINQDSKNKEHYQSLKSIFEESSEVVGMAEMQEDWGKIEAAIIAAGEKTPDRKKVMIWLIRVAAVVILAIGTTLILNLQKDDFTIRGNSDKPVAAILPDGSEVFLTKGSRISYSRSFNQELREVRITGEAYFSVSSDPNRPFIVQSGEVKIRVTGTSFRVSAPIRNDEVEVLVRSGKVLFYNSETFSENSFKVGLGPGDKGIYSSKLNQLNKTHNTEYKQLKWN